MYISVHPGHLDIPHMFRWLARAAGAIVFASWLLLFIDEMFRFGPPAVRTSGQAVALAVVFAGYFMTWRHELAGAIATFVGTAAFVAVYLFDFAELPATAVWWFAVPGVLSLLAWQLNRYRGTSAPSV